MLKTRSRYRGTIPAESAQQLIARLRREGWVVSDDGLIMGPRCVTPAGHISTVIYREGRAEKCVHYEAARVDSHNRPTLRQFSAESARPASKRGRLVA